jgi:hypothetical protein
MNPLIDFTGGVLLCTAMARRILAFLAVRFSGAGKELYLLAVNK